MDNEDEPWHIVQLFSLYEFRDERATIWDNDECASCACLAHKGANSSRNWRTCIDFMLNYHGEWTSLEKYEEAKCQSPISEELEVFARQRCTRSPSTLFPSCARTNKGIYNSAISDDATNESGNLLNEDLPSIFNDDPIENSTDENSNMGKDTDKE